MMFLLFDIYVYAFKIYCLRIIGPDQMQLIIIITIYAQYAIYYAPCMHIYIHRSSIMRKTKFLREVRFMVPFLKIHAEQDALGPNSQVSATFGSKVGFI